MIRGVVKVVDNIESVDTSKVDPSTLPSAGGGSCCGGGAASGTSSQGYSIYGDDISKVPTDKLVKKATLLGNYQAIGIKGVGYEFEPLVVVVNEGIKTKLSIDLYSFELPEGKYQIINGDTGKEVASFEGKRGINEVEFTINDSAVFGIIKDGSALGLIQGVEDLKKADLEEIRAKYIN